MKLVPERSKELGVGIFIINFKIRPREDSVLHLGIVYPPHKLQDQGCVASPWPTWLCKGKFLLPLEQKRAGFSFSRGAQGSLPLYAASPASTGSCRPAGFACSASLGSLL